MFSTSTVKQVWLLSSCIFCFLCIPYLNEESRYVSSATTLQDILQVKNTRKNRSIIVSVVFPHVACLCDTVQLTLLLLINLLLLRQSRLLPLQLTLLLLQLTLLLLINLLLLRQSRLLLLQLTLLLLINLLSAASKPLVASKPCSLFT